MPNAIRFIVLILVAAIIQVIGYPIVTSLATDTGTIYAGASLAGFLSGAVFQMYMNKH